MTSNDDTFPDPADVRRDAVALIIAVAERDKDAWQALLAGYDGTEALMALVGIMADVAYAGFEDVARLAMGLGTDDEMPQAKVLEYLRRVLRNEAL